MHQLREAKSLKNGGSQASQDADTQVQGDGEKTQSEPTSERDLSDSKGGTGGKGG